MLTGNVPVTWLKRGKCSMGCAVVRVGVWHRSRVFGVQRVVGAHGSVDINGDVRERLIVVEWMVVVVALARSLDWICVLVGWSGLAAQPLDSNSHHWSQHAIIAILLFENLKNPINKHLESTCKCCDSNFQPRMLDNHHGSNLNFSIYSHRTLEQLLCFWQDQDTFQAYVMHISLVSKKICHLENDWL